nr:phage tail tape measure protein [Bacillus pseudomycoides]
MAEFGAGVDKSMQEVLDKTKISADQFGKWGQAIAGGGENGQKAMLEATKALAGVENATDRNALGTKMFGTLWEDQGKKIIDTILKAEGKQVDLKKGVEDLHGATSKIDASPAVKFQKAMEDLKMALEPVLSVVADLISKFAEWVSNNPQLAATLTAVAVAVGVIAGAFMALAPIVVTISSIGLAMTGWIALFAVIIAAVVALGVVIYNNWESIKQWTIEAWDSIKEYLVGLWDGIAQFFSDLWAGIGEVCSNAWNSIAEFFSGAWASFTEMMHSFFDPIGQFFSDLWSGIIETASSWWSSLVTTASELWGTLTQVWQDTWNTILTVLDPIISLISTVLQAAWLLITAATQIAWATISKYIIDPITAAYNWCKEKLGDLGNWILQKWEDIKSYTLAAWSLFKQYIVDPVSQAWNWVKEKLGDLADWILGKWETIKSYTLSAWNLVKQYIIDPIVSAYNSVKDTVSDLYNTAKDRFESLKNAAKEKFDAAKSYIVDPIKDAVETVKGWIDKIKGFFSDLKLKIPSPEMPKLPHFSLKTSSTTILGKDITYPSGIDIDWYAKGGIFTKPTIFGMNGGNLQGAGEAGREAVLPLNRKTLGDIGRGIAATMEQTSPNEQLFDITDTMNQLASSMSELSGLKSVMSGVYGSMASNRQSMVSNVTNSTVNLGGGNYGSVQAGMAGVLPMQGGDLVIEVPVHLEGKDVARGTYRYTTEYQKREEERNSAFKG